MKKVAFTIIALCIATAFTACKNEAPEASSLEPNKDLAVAEIDTTPTTDYLYVTASSGLTLREFDNLNSEKLAVMPYGTKLEVLSEEENATMTVGGILGGMHQVSYNNKEGYAFNGFLSKFFPPEKNTSAKVYVNDLKATFPKASFTETSGGTASKPTNTEVVLLPTEKWHEAFFIAQKLYDIPATFQFPNPNGSDLETLENPKKPVQITTSNLAIERQNNALQQITYTQEAEGFGANVAISQEGAMMKIEYTTVVE